jgi:hypothetical protein
LRYYLGDDAVPGFLEKKAGENEKENLTLAMKIADDVGVMYLMDVEDYFIGKAPEPKSVQTQVIEFYKYFGSKKPVLSDKPLEEVVSNPSTPSTPTLKPETKGEPSPATDAHVKVRVRHSVKIDSQPKPEEKKELTEEEKRVAEQKDIDDQIEEKIKRYEEQEAMKKNEEDRAETQRIQEKESVEALEKQRLDQLESDRVEMERVNVQNENEEARRVWETSQSKHPPPADLQVKKSMGSRLGQILPIVLSLAIVAVGVAYYLQESY